jgi:hypothetical protein
LEIETFIPYEGISRSVGGAGGNLRRWPAGGASSWSNLKKKFKLEQRIEKLTALAARKIRDQMDF